MHKLRINLIDCAAKSSQAKQQPAINSKPTVQPDKPLANPSGNPQPAKSSAISQPAKQSVIPQTKVSQTKISQPKISQAKISQAKIPPVKSLPKPQPPIIPIEQASPLLSKKKLKQQIRSESRRKAQDMKMQQIMNAIINNSKNLGVRHVPENELGPRHCKYII